MRTYLILTAAVLLSACGGSGTLSNGGTTSPSPNPGAGTPVTIVSGASTMTTTAFSPNPVNVTVGTTVTWTNADNVTHTSVSDKGVWNSGNIAPGANFSQTFSTAGTFTYHCVIHPNMVASVIVQ